MTKKIYLILLFISCVELCHAQKGNRLDSLMNVLKNSKEDSLKINLLLHCSRINMNGGNFSQSLQLAEEALKLSKKLNYKTGVAPVFSILGGVAQLQGHYPEAIKNHFTALKNYEEIGDRLGVATAYANISNVYFFQSNYEESLKNDLAALKISEELNDSLYMASFLNNIGETYQLLENYDSALACHTASLRIKLAIKDSQGIGTSYSNLANIKIRMAEKDSIHAHQWYKEALKSHLNALQMRLRINDAQGIAESYINMGSIETRLNEMVLAKKYLDSAVAFSKSAGYHEIRKEAYNAISYLYEKTGDWKSAIKYHKGYSELKDSLLNEGNQRAIAEMKTKYETEKKEDENIWLSKENELKNMEISNQKKQKYYLFVLVFLSVIIYILIYNRRKLNREKLQKEEMLRMEKLRTQSMVMAQEQERKRISEELHDGIGQMLSAVKLNVSALEENVKDENKLSFDTAVKLIDNSCDEIRNISHNLLPGVLLKRGLVPAIEELAGAVNQSGAIKISVNCMDFEERTEPQAKVHIFRIIQEWINNIQKHSVAKEVHIRLNKTEWQLTLTIEDDGKGFNTALLNQGKGNGWHNIESRIEILGAICNMDSKKDKGTILCIEVPLKN